MKLYTIFFSLMILLSCSGTNDPEVADKLSLIDYLDRSCSVRIPTKSMKQSYVDSWSLSNDTLSLIIRFQNTCNSKYSEDINIVGNNLHILLTDTSTQHGRCTCDHASICIVQVLDGNQVNIDFDVKFYAQENFTNCIDTLLTIR